MTEPKIRLLEPGDEAALETFLLTKIDSSMFLLGNLYAAGLVDDGERLQGTYVAAFDDERVIGVAAHYRTGSLLLQASEHLPVLWKAAVEVSGRPISGVSGPANQAFAVRNILAVAGAQFRMNCLEDLYSLALDRLRTPSILAENRVHGRRMAASDLDLLTRWSVEYSIEALNEMESKTLWRKCRERMERSLDEGTVWILEDAGELVARTLFNTTIPEAVQIGGVYTPPPLRGQGYARAVVAQSLLDAREEGASRAILFADTDNAAAQKAYISLGFRIVGEYAIVLLQKAMMMPTPIPGDRSDGVISED